MMHEVHYFMSKASNKKKVFKALVVANTEQEVRTLFYKEYGRDCRIIKITTQ